ncbi:MAG TPA: hypothetical protein VGI85_02715 [Chthoniobacterales bacterium]|jgi:hypothetical protein
MEKFSVRRGTVPLLCLLILLGALASCGKKKQAAKPTPSASPAAAASPSGPTPAPPISVPVTPAIVKQGPDSITHYLHFPADPAEAKRNSVVQFYCDITDEGIVEATYGLVGKDEAFKRAVQTALDWGHFTPATLDGKPVPAYVGGTVIFLHENGAPVIAVSLATHDRERVGKLSNYIQPQLIGGLRREVAKVIRQIPHNFPVAGIAEADVQVDARGAVTSTSIVGETPKGSGLGELLNVAVKGAQFTHAYQNGKAAAGAVDVVADFSKL